GGRRGAGRGMTAAAAMRSRMRRVGTVVNVYPAVIALAGLAALIAQIVLMPPTIESWPRIVALIALVTALRWFVVPLSKYSYLSFTSFGTLAGSLLFGPAMVSIALVAGALFADWGLLRKSWRAAVINGGREVLSLTAAFGLYAFALRQLGVAGHELGVDVVPAIAFFILGNFVIG